MEISYHELTWKGLVRPKNEDFLGFRQPSDHEEWRTRGAISIICDGVGGQGNGDVASKMAVERALEAYAAAPRGTPPISLLRQMFNAANLAVYDASLENRSDNKRMATTMTAALFRHHQVHVGHVGDCRLYHI